MIVVMPAFSPATAPLAHQPTGRFPPPDVRAVVFDVVHTLVEPFPPVAVAYHDAACRHGVRIDPSIIYDRFAASWKRQEEIDAAANPAFATHRHREAERWRQIVDEVFEGVPQSEDIFADLWEHFGRPAAWRPLAIGRELLLTARAAGLTVALASNFDERLLVIARVVEPLTLADHVFASSELGWRKPAPAFFTAVADRLGMRPDELLLVGDDPVLDLAAARRSGWQAWPIG
jgi:putative hydrolase of the HAD superfamily